MQNWTRLPAVEQKQASKESQLASQKSFPVKFFNSESYILFIQINKGLEYHFISLF